MAGQFRVLKKLRDLIVHNLLSGICKLDDNSILGYLTYVFYSDRKYV